MEKCFPFFLFGFEDRFDASERSELTMQYGFKCVPMIQLKFQLSTVISTYYSHFRVERRAKTCNVKQSNHTLM